MTTVGAPQVRDHAPCSGPRGQYARAPIRSDHDNRVEDVHYLCGAPTMIVYGHGIECGGSQKTSRSTGNSFPKPKLNLPEQERASTENRAAKSPGYRVPRGGG